MLPAGGTERRRSTDGEQRVVSHYADVIAISSGLSESRVGAGHTGAADMYLAWIGQLGLLPAEPGGCDHRDNDEH